MDEKLLKLQKLLKELFQLNEPDLDFGLYRIMHAKAGEVQTFLSKGLPEAVNKAFSKYQSSDKSSIQLEIDNAARAAQSAGFDPEQSPKVKELRAKLATTAVDIDSLRGDVFSHLFTFFRRYYSEGDFLSKQVYKDGVYAIPYRGEEVKLHWANADQYYIKSSQYLRQFAFKVSEGEPPRRVVFKLVDATEGAHGNVKEAAGQSRVFVLCKGDFAKVEEGPDGHDLVLQFEYRQVTMADAVSAAAGEAKKVPKQDTLLANAAVRILALTDPALHAWLVALRRKAPTDKKPDRTELDKRLEHWTKSNTFDYFIHKDLGGFLRRELDFYIKNEVMHLDDIERETEARFGQYLSKIRVLREVAGAVIQFLAQLEEFQKRLWLKKKFVVETSWCVRVGLVPEEMLAEVAANDAQRAEWVELCGINEFRGDLTIPGYAVPLTIAFLKAHPGLMVDARHFSAAFADRLLAAFGDVDEVTDGVLFHSENFQALSMMEARYRQRIKCVYIDPPYNTASSSIPYKNDYKHSSFAALMKDRIQALWATLPDDGAIFVSIDKTERTIVQYVLDQVFGDENRVEELIWSMNTNNSQAPNYSTNHEYVLVYAKNRAVAERDKSMFREPKPGFAEMMALVAELNPRFPPIAEIEAEIRRLYQRHRTQLAAELEDDGLDWESEKGIDPWKGLYNYTHAEYRDATGALVAPERAQLANAHIWIWQEGDASMPATKQAASTGDSKHKNYRYYRPIHPVSGRPTPHPKSGWKFAFDADVDSPDKRSFVALDRDGRIAWGPDETKVPRLKRMLHEVETNVAKSVFADYSDGEKQTSALFGRSGIFLAPKHADFVARFIQHGARSNSTILDCFGGSGSTAHAVVTMNRRAGGRRKFVLAEMGDHFGTVILPRLKKVTFTPEWKDGKPKRLATPEETDRAPRILKILRLESYEDTLNNLALRARTAREDDLFAANPAFHQQYLLKYLLPTETAGSPSLLDLGAFADPTAYTLKVKRPGSDESRETAVDLIETFNWLLGLSVNHYGAPATYDAAFAETEHGRLEVTGRLRPDPTGKFWLRSLTGKAPNGDRVLVVWRKLTGQLDRDNAVLDSWFATQRIKTTDAEFDVMYVNGDNNLENLKRDDETWKVRRTEDEFYRLMFADADAAQVEV